MIKMGKHIANPWNGNTSDAISYGKMEQKKMNVEMQSRVTGAFYFSKLHTQLVRRIVSGY